MLRSLDGWIELLLGSDLLMALPAELYDLFGLLAGMVIIIQVIIIFQDIKTRGLE
jgi:hypothetical protein